MAPTIAHGNAPSSGAGLMRLPSQLRNPEIISTPSSRLPTSSHASASTSRQAAAASRSGAQRFSTGVRPSTSSSTGRAATTGAANGDHCRQKEDCSCRNCTEEALVVQQFYDRQRAIVRLEDDEIVFLGDGAADNGDVSVIVIEDIEVLDPSGSIAAAKRTTSPTDIVILATPEAKLKICDVCTDEKRQTEFYKLKPCLHAFCRECLEKSITVAIEDRNVKKIKCLAADCAHLVEYVDVARLLSDVNKFKEYDHLLTQNEITGMGDIEACPNPACGMQCFSIRAEGDGTVLACPHCGHYFCLLCKKVVLRADAEARTHRCELSNPIIIEAMNKYENSATPEAERKQLERHYGKQKLDNLIADRLSQRVIEEKKKCPHCRAPTEKNSGCNHMTCRMCRTEWCWLCGGKMQANQWRDHYASGTCGNRLFEGVNVNAPLPAAVAAYAANVANVAANVAPRLLNYLRR